MHPTSAAMDIVERELALAYHDLGTAAFALVHHGGLRDPRLGSRVRRIYELTGVHSPAPSPISCVDAQPRLRVRRERER
jgi:hypothetical protein